MALMYPRTGPKQTNSPYERVVYKALEQQLIKHDYQVFHSISWDRSLTNPGEADFVVTHPDHGLLVLEVKGGQKIRKDAGEGWWSQDKNDNWHDLGEGPYEQSRKNAWNIHDQFKEQLVEWGYYDSIHDISKTVIRHDHAVIMEPDFEPSATLRKDDIERTLTGSSIEELGDFIENRMARMHWQDEEFTRENRKLHLQWLSDFLDRNVKAETNFKTKASEVGIYLTEKETELLGVELESILANRRMNVIGGAGTGKTVLAIRAAQEFAKQGKRVLWVCFNELLAQHVSETLSGTSVKVHYYDSLRKEVVGRINPAGVHSLFNFRPTDSDAEENLRQDAFEEGLTELLEEYEVDCLIIDEGQDFRRKWFDLLVALVEEVGSDGHVSVFQDDNQAIYRDELRDLADLGYASRQLSRNNRNTAQIHTAASRLYTGCRYSGSGIAGDEVQYRLLEKSSEKDAKVREIVEDLIHQGFTGEQVVVLTGGNGKVRRKMKDNSDGLMENFTEREGTQIGIETARRFKGLESDVVILTDVNRLMWSPDSANDDGVRKTVYSTISRAKKLLFVVDQQEPISELKSMLK